MASLRRLRIEKYRGESNSRTSCLQVSPDEVATTEAELLPLVLAPAPAPTAVARRVLCLDGSHSLTPVRCLQVRPDEAATLEAELSPLVSTPLRAALFSKDFKKHCEAAAVLVDACGTLTEEVSDSTETHFCF